MTMAGNKRSSKYDLYRGRFAFTTEPIWARIALTVITFFAAIAIALLLGRYALPVFCVRLFSRLAWIKRLLRKAFLIR